MGSTNLSTNNYSFVEFLPAVLKMSFNAWQLTTEVLNVSTLVAVLVF